MERHWCCEYIDEFKFSGRWHEEMTIYAADSGHLDCLEYALKNGCPWDEQDTLSYLNYDTSSTIDLDDKWWRTFLFDKDLTNHTSLETLVNSKKEEIKQLQLSSEILFSYTSADVIKYVLWAYF